jgi:two-component system phosphate regulon sensor histidine kinase PhoR
MDARGRAALAVGASLNPDEVVSTIARQACLLTGSQHSAVYLFDAVANILQLVTGYHLPDVLVGTTTPPGQGAIGRAFRRRRAIVVNNAARRSEMAVVSLVAQGERWGVLEVTRRRRFSAKDIATLEWFAPLAAGALANAQAFDHSIQTVSQLQTSNEMWRAVGNAARAMIDVGYDLDRMLTKVLERTLSSLNLRGGAVWLYSQSTGQLEVVVERNLPDAARSHLTADRAILVEPLAGVEDDGTLANLLLVVGERITGVMQVVTAPGQTLSLDDLDALVIVANQLSLGIENARFFQRVGTEQQRLRAILSSTNDVVLSVDAEGRLLIANVAAERAFGFSAQACTGHVLSEAVTHPVLKIALDQTRLQRNARTRTFQISLSDERVLSSSVSPIVAQDGTVQGWVFVMQDITQFKEIEKLQADIVLTVSHEMRNPINLTLGALELLERTLETPTESQRDALGLVKLGTERTKSLIEDLLDLERIERRVGLTMKRCDCVEVARTTWSAFRLQAQSRAVSLEAHLPDTALSVWGDARLLDRMMSNLVGNALKYTPQGGRVTIEARGEGDQVILEVCDTGQGIPLEAQSRIFERFYRLPNQPDGVKGTGLGLTIVKSIVERHGGRVWVTSQSGCGTTFTVSLPTINMAK